MKSSRQALNNKNKIKELVLQRIHKMDTNSQEVQLVQSKAYWMDEATKKN